jgi:hypothetical protein
MLNRVLKLTRWWGRGFATEAPKGALDYGWRELNLAKVYAGHHPDNRASQRILDLGNVSFVAGGAGERVRHAFRETRFGQFTSSPRSRPLPRKPPKLSKSALFRFVDC